MSIWYNGGTLAVESGSASVVGTGTLFLTQAKDGDMLFTLQGGTLRLNQIVSRADDTNFTIEPAWDGTTASGLAYYIVATSPDWGDVSSVANDLATFLANRATFFPTNGKPDDGLGGNGSFAVDPNATPPKLYVKTDGTWDNGTSLGGPKGDTGAGYGGTSSDTKTLVSSGSMSFTTQAGLAWQSGSRIRMASATAPTTKWMEGVITSYSSTTLVVTIDKQGSGSGSASDWTFSPAGIPGEKGDTGATGATGSTGATGAQGLGYGGTSTTSRAIGSSGTMTWNIGTGYAYQNGDLVKITNTADVTKWMKGKVSGYSAGVLSVDISESNGSDTLASWNIGLAGETGPKGDVGTAATLAVGATTTVAAGGAASVTNSGTTSAAVFDFSIPRGADGADGNDGTNFDPDARGLFASRFLHDGEVQGYAYLSIDGDGNTITSPVLFFKLSAANGNWSAAFPFGTNVGKPLVILATGQSNFVLQPDYSWTPAPNAKIWNWDGTTTHIGTAFQAINNAKINCTWKFASDIAYANPDRTVYLVNISIGSQPIAQWLPGASSPDMYADVKANIEPALSAIGAGKIDALFWWQGEADMPAPTGWPANFESVISRFKGETWFPPATPTFVYALLSDAASTVTGEDRTNLYIQKAVSAAPDTRTFIYTSFLPSASFNGVHMTAVGYEGAGALGAQAFLGRSARASVKGITVSDAGVHKFGGAELRATAEGTPHIDLFDGTPPSGTLTGGWSLYSVGGEPYAMTAAGAAFKLNGRQVLLADRDYYVNGSTGSDSNNGLTSGAAFATLQKAVDTVHALDLSIYSVTIHVADYASYAGAILGPLVGSGSATIIGNETTPANCVISTGATATHCLRVRGNGWVARGFKTVSSGAQSHHILVDGNFKFTYGKWEFGAASGSFSYHVSASNGGKITFNSNYTISGGADTHWRADTGGVISRDLVTAITLTGTPAFTTAFAFAWRGSGLFVANQTFSGSATGQRFTVGSASYITTFSGTSYLPGSVAGAADATTFGSYN